MLQSICPGNVRVSVFRAESQMLLFFFLQNIFDPSDFLIWFIWTTSDRKAPFHSNPCSQRPQTTCRTRHTAFYISVWLINQKISLSPISWIFKSFQVSFFNNNCGPAFYKMNILCIVWEWKQGQILPDIPPAVPELVYKQISAALLTIPTMLMGHGFTKGCVGESPRGRTGLL